MKTNLKKYMMALALSPMLLSSCGDDFLDEINPTQQTPATFWVNEENAMKGLSAAYHPLRQRMQGYYGAFKGIHYLSMRADDLYPTRGEEGFNWTYLTFTNTPNDMAIIWNSIYQGIALANEFLYQAPNVPMDKAKLDQMMGEAYFLRGYWYFRLRCDYNEGVIRTLPQTVDSEQHGLSSPEEIIDQCIADFTKAKELLKDVKKRPKEENGRVTQGAAIAMLGKALIWKGEYAKAKAELDQIINDNGYGYGLVENYGDNFRDGEYEFNKESVFEIDYDNFGSGGQWSSSDGPNARMDMNLYHFFGACLKWYIGPKESRDGGWYKMQPSPYLIYQFTREERPEGADSRWDKRLYANCFFEYSDYNDVKKDETFFGDLKVPFDSIYFCTVQSKENKWRLDGTGSPMYPKIDGKMGRFIWKKWTTWWSDRGSTMYGSNVNCLTNLRLIRFAEVLFLHAEAALESGDLATAMNDINRIRVRAGLAEKHLSDKAAITEELRNQKLLEFAGENIRWDDLVRWYSYDELKALLLKRKVDSSKYVVVGEEKFPQDNGASRKVYAPAPDADYYPGCPGLLDTQNYAGFEKKHMYFPIPQSEVDANEALEQKADWK